MRDTEARFFSPCFWGSLANRGTYGSQSINNKPFKKSWEFYNSYCSLNCSDKLWKIKHFYWQQFDVGLFTHIHCFCSCLLPCVAYAVWVIQFVKHSTKRPHNSNEQVCHLFVDAYCLLVVILFCFFPPYCSLVAAGCLCSAAVHLSCIQVMTKTPTDGSN